MNRRDVLVAGTAGIATGAATMAAAPVDFPEPRLTFAFQAEVLLAQIQELGTIDGVRRRIVPIIGGTVAGPRLTATVLPGGADWQGIRPGDGLTRVWARYWIKTEDGTAIGIENAGIRRASAAIMQRLMSGEVVPPSAYYFRTVPQFEVGEGPYQWLNETVFVGIGARLRDRALIRIYSVT